MKGIVVVSIVLAVVCCGVSFGEVPQLINYQGRLNDADGQPVDGTVVLGFGFYGRPDLPPMGGDAMRRYYEEQNVEVADGIFNVLIGNGVNRYGSFDAIASGDPVYLQIFVNPNPSSPVPGLMPRQRIGSVVFALRAGTSDALEARVAALEQLLAHFTRNGNDIYIDGANLHVRNSTDATETTNGLGNLIVGYNEERGEGADNRSGSHNIVVGKKNSFSSWGGVVVGQSNTVSAPYATVTAGHANTASGSYSSVSGGRYNTASGEGSSVVGGGGSDIDDGNVAFGDYSAVLGGTRNIAGDGNLEHHAVGPYTTVSGGMDNTASGTGASVSGGKGNLASSTCASVSGGGENAARGVGSSVGGGCYNTASGEYSSVAGGGGDLPASGNKAFGNYTAILGGQENVAGDATLVDHGIGARSTISGGSWGVASGLHSSVSGGNNNTASGDFSSVSGGYRNSANAASASVSGGENNIADGKYASVSGGERNKATGQSASVSGGTYCEASGEHASVSGGSQNLAKSTSSSVSGGNDNTAGRSSASVSGGSNRTASGVVLWRAGDLWLTTTQQWPSCTELEIAGAGGAP